MNIFHYDGSSVAQNVMVREPQLDSRALKYNPTAWLSGYAGTGVRENWGNTLSTWGCPT